MAEQWLSIVEYAKKHDISDMTVRRRIRAGKVEAELREGKYFIRVGSAPSATSAPVQRGASPTPPPPIRHPDRHLEQLLDRTAHPKDSTPELRYSPAKERGYNRPKPPPIPVPPPEEPRAYADRRSQMDRRRPQRSQQRPAEDDFSYPELDLAGTRQPAAGVIDGGHSIEVQLSQLTAKLDHLAQPWQQELLASLKTEIALKDDKIQQLQQKVADLEMIIQMFDSSKGNSINLSDVEIPKDDASVDGASQGVTIPPPPQVIPRR